MKRIYIKLVVVALIIFCILTVSSHVFGFAFDPEDYRPNAVSISDAEEPINIAGRAIGSIKDVGVIIAVIALTIIGLKYIFSSVDEKAKYKESMLPWVIGIVFITCSGLLVDTFYSTITGDSTHDGHTEQYYNEKEERARNVTGVIRFYAYINEFYSNDSNGPFLAIEDLPQANVIKVFTDFEVAYAAALDSAAYAPVFAGLTFYQAHNSKLIKLAECMSLHFEFEGKNKDKMAKIITATCRKCKEIKARGLQTIPDLQEYINKGFETGSITEHSWYRVEQDYINNKDYYAHAGKYAEAINALIQYFGHEPGEHDPIA